MVKNIIISGFALVAVVSAAPTGLLIDRSGISVDIEAAAALVLGQGSVTGSSICVVMPKSTSTPASKSSSSSASGSASSKSSVPPPSSWSLGDPLTLLKPTLVTSIVLPSITPWSRPVVTVTDPPLSVYTTLTSLPVWSSARSSSTPSPSSSGGDVIGRVSSVIEHVLPSSLAPYLSLPSLPAVTLPSKPALSIPSLPALTLPSKPTLSLPTVPVIGWPTIAESSKPTATSLATRISTSVSPASASAGISSAGPSASPSAPAIPATGLRQVARFDNADGIPLVALSPINYYLDLFWQGFRLAETASLQNVALVKPNSPPNVASFGALNLLQGGQASIQAAYADSTVSAFDLDSFYFGCVLPVPPLAILALPSSCTITVRAYSDDAATKQAGSTQVLKFAIQPGQTSSEMSKATVNFKGVKTVKFSVDGLVAGLIDTVSYTVYGGRGY
ncbi:hypothetical protein ACEQ8H_008135 [Pleosporales sp. CAS-2024a]